MVKPPRKLAFILASTDHGTMIGRPEPHKII